ncbi:MAG: transketolase [Candidatus Odinarchaeota archaeon]
MELSDLEEKATWVRHKVLDMVYQAGRGHIGSSLSCVELLVAIYYSGMFDFPNDKFILSKGHACASLYAILADLGYFDLEQLETFNQEFSVLEGHANNKVNGIEVSTGSLGQGLGIGVGYALGMHMKNEPYKVVVLMSDGECWEGTVWEAAMLAAHHHLSNLILIVDRNQQCVLDYTESVNRLEPLAYKWEAFGWHFIEAEGHSFEDLMLSLYQATLVANKPIVIIADTIKGKGIPFMERNVAWHHSPLTEELYKEAQSGIGY